MSTATSAPRRPRHGITPPAGWRLTHDDAPCRWCGGPTCLIDPAGARAHPLCAGHGDRRAHYDAYLSSPLWQATRRQVLERAGGRCEHCDAATRLDVHHKTYARLDHERLTDLVALCRDCHEDADAEREEEAAFATWVEKVYGEAAVYWGDDFLRSRFERWLERKHEEVW